MVANTTATELWQVRRDDLTVFAAHYSSLRFHSSCFILATLPCCFFPTFHLPHLPHLPYLLYFVLNSTSLVIFFRRAAILSDLSQEPVLLTVLQESPGHGWWRELRAVCGKCRACPHAACMYGRAFAGALHRASWLIYLYTHFHTHIYMLMWYPCFFGWPLLFVVHHLMHR
jgi:hypothetical protein